VWEGGWSEAGGKKIEKPLVVGFPQPSPTPGQGAAGRRLRPVCDVDGVQGREWERGGVRHAEEGRGGVGGGGGMEPPVTGSHGHEVVRLAAWVGDVAVTPCGWVVRERISGMSGRDPMFGYSWVGLELCICCVRARDGRGGSRGRGGGVGWGGGKTGTGKKTGGWGLGGWGAGEVGVDRGGGHDVGGGGPSRGNTGGAGWGERVGGGGGWGWWLGGGKRGGGGVCGGSEGGGGEDHWPGGARGEAGVGRRRVDVSNQVGRRYMHLVSLFPACVAWICGLGDTGGAGWGGGEGDFCSCVYHSIFSRRGVRVGVWHRRLGPRVGAGCGGGLEVDSVLQWHGAGGGSARHAEWGTGGEETASPTTPHAMSGSHSTGHQKL